MACIKLVHVAQVNVENFQNGLQFYILSANFNLQQVLTIFLKQPCTHQRIMRVITRLRHQHSIGGLDKMMAADIRHDLRTGYNLDVEFLLELVPCL